MKSRIWVLSMVLTTALAFLGLTVPVVLGAPPLPTRGTPGGVVVDPTPGPNSRPEATNTPQIAKGPEDGVGAPSGEAWCEQSEIIWVAGKPRKVISPVPCSECEGPCPPIKLLPRATNTLQIVNRTPTAITLRWHDRSDIEGGNRVLRHTLWTFPIQGTVEVTDLGPLDTSDGWVEYTDTTVSPGDWYCYRVQPYNGHGHSNSNTACDSILQPATEAKRTYRVNHDLELAEGQVVTKRLILEGKDASGVTVNCNGAVLNGGPGTVNHRKDMIEIRSKYIEDERRWERPENITIKNCNIVGSVRVWGMARNGEGEHLRESSRLPGHVERARNNAPRNIVFDEVTITGVGRNPVYFAPGVTDSKLINSEIKGKSDRVGIYLDAESCCNTIKDNKIHVKTGKDWRREFPQIAVDGSSRNKIMNNRFSSLNHGGIYLYRNCGYKGTIRLSTPSHNQIINNIFDYDKYKGGNPAVYLGAHSGGFWRTYPWFGTCRDDDGYDFGSSASDLDYAKYNVVMQNQIYKRSVSDMIRINYWAYVGGIAIPIYTTSNTPNYIDYNETVDAETVEDRPAGCYVTKGYKQDRKDFILHGESIDVFRNSNGEPICADYEWTCNDGDLSRSATSSCQVSKVSFDCQVSGNNSGCRETASCPSDQRIIGATAACNLEHGTISNSTLATVPANRIKVIEASDSVSAGSCYVGSNSLHSGQKTISGIDGLDRVSVGCKEHDRNGGDCHIKGILYCR